MTDRLAELGALQYAVENLSTAGTSQNRLALAGYIHAAYTDYQAWAAANPGVNPNRLSAKGRLYGYFYDNASWSPSELFANGEVGAWYDPSDLTTMFQDRAGTTPVTADGQTVGKILDKSGRGNHATAPSDAARPLYKTDGTYHWLQYDGVDDSLSTAAIDFTGTDASTVFSGALKNNNTAIATIADFNGAWANVNSFGLASTISAGVSEAGFKTRGSGLSSSSSVSFSTSTKSVLTGIGDISTDTSKVRVNSTEGSSSSDQGLGNYANADLRIGSSLGYYFHVGNIYSIIVLGRLATTQEITDTETWVNSKTGAY